MIIGSSASPFASIAALRSATADVAKATERISTTLRINHAGDDPGGLGMANRLKAQLGSMVKAVDNVNAGIAVQQRVDSALTSISDTLQSMRTLATSAASGTASAADRTGYQLAMTSYLSQIDDLSAATTWNGNSILDGSSSSITVQSGVGAGDTTTLTLFSTLSSALGTGDALTVSAAGSYAASGSTLAVMYAGDLTIGGVSVGATRTTDDTLSSSDKAGSAIAKVAAINRLTSTTNVAATVGTTTVSGTSMTTAASATSTVKINGTDISLTLSASNSISANRAAVVAAINLNQGVTGVTATDSGDSTRGVILTAADGRNITIAYNGSFTAAETGLGAAGTYSGSYTLRSLSGSSVTLSSVTGKSIANAGLVAGTYSANVAQLASTTRSGSTSAPSTLVSGDMMINGYAIGDAYTTDDTASPVTTTSSTRASSAIAMAAAINRQSSLTNVTATANANTLTGSGYTTGSVTSIFLNGTTISVNFSSSTTLDDIVTAINPYQGQTGVVATNNGSGITLTASDGRNIAIGVSDSSGAVDGKYIGLDGLKVTSAAAATGTAMTFISTVTLSSDAVFTVAPGSNGATKLAALGFRAGTYGATAEDVKLSAVDVSTQTGASNALSVIDDAIDMIGEYQSLVGAQQNRLDFQSTYLDSVYTTTTGAYDNIMNADIAEETANLTSAQIRVDGSTAMVAQAATITKEMVTYLLKQFD